MPRTQRILQADLPVPDGMINLSAVDLKLLSGTAPLTKIATGEISLRATAASVVLASLGGPVLRFGMQDDLQERFGSGVPNGSGGSAIGFPSTLSTANAAAGSQVNIAVLSSVNWAVGMSVTVDTVASTVQEVTYVTAIPDSTHITVNALANSHTSPFPLVAHVFTTPAGVSGSPPFTGVTQLTPVTVPRPKGLRFKQFNLRYIINTSNATVNTFGVTSIQYTNAVAAPTATNIIANAANGLATASSTTPYVTPVPVPVANQNFLTTQNTDVIIEWDVTPGTSVDLLGITAICDVNMN